MSDASKAFLASPTDFMKKNLLVIDDAGMWHVSEDREFDLIPAGSGLSASGTGIPMYRLQKANDRTTDPIPAYWLAMKDGGIEAQQLTTTRTIFFTQGLSGCGFVAGSGGAPLVKHIDGDKYRNDQIINDPANAGMDIYTGANYEAGEESSRGQGRATVFGVKGATGWAFWAQAWFYTPAQKYQLRFREGIMPV
jgi:hypothetical protein